MRCLVFGGTGMLGQAVVAEARSRGWAALGLSRAQADIADAGGLLGWADSFRPELSKRHQSSRFAVVTSCGPGEDRGRARSWRRAVPIPMR